MLHRSCDNARVVSNNVYDNGEAGIALYESSSCKVLSNTVTDNLRESFRGCIRLEIDPPSDQLCGLLDIEAITVFPVDRKVCLPSRSQIHVVGPCPMPHMNARPNSP